MKQSSLEATKKNVNYSDISLGIICPMANVKDTAVNFVNDVLDSCRPFGFKSLMFYVVFDGACTDGSYDILKSFSEDTPELVVIFAPENRSVVDAYKRGYREAIENSSDWILEIDAEYSHRPEDIPQFFHAMKDGGFDCVFGSRFCKNGKIIDSSFKRRVISLVGTYLTNLLLGTKLHDMTSGFELFTRDALVWILDQGVYSNGPFFQTEIKTHAHKLKIIEVPIIYSNASHNISNQAISDSLSNLLRLFKLRFQ